MNSRNDAVSLPETRAFAGTAGQYQQSVRQLMEQTGTSPSKNQDDFNKDISVLLGLFA
jgi:hypothetical protein